MPRMRVNDYPASAQSRHRLSVVLGAVIIAVGMMAGARQPDRLNSPAAMPRSFSHIDDFETQVGELVDAVNAQGLPRRTTQVDLDTHRKVSQYTDIDSSPAGYGKNACGLVAAAAALGGSDWVALADAIAQAAGDDYRPQTGIQPSRYLAALRQVFGARDVWALRDGSLGELYTALEAGHVVIVDIKVNANARAPSARPPNYAHFARVLGMDLDRREVYVENTLRGEAYWTIRLGDFWEAWKHPETSATLILDRRRAEDVTRWAVVVSGAWIP